MLELVDYFEEAMRAKGVIISEKAKQNMLKFINQEDINNVHYTTKYDRGEPTILGTINWCYPDNDIFLSLVDKNNLWLFEADCDDISRNFALMSYAFFLKFKPEWLEITKAFVASNSNHSHISYAGNDTDCSDVWLCDKSGDFDKVFKYKSQLYFA